LKSGDNKQRSTEKSELDTGLKQRYMTMIELGGVIGAGLFVGQWCRYSANWSSGDPVVSDYWRLGCTGYANAWRNGMRNAGGWFVL